MSEHSQGRRVSHDDFHALGRAVLSRDQQSHAYRGSEATSSRALPPTLPQGLPPTHPGNVPGSFPREHLARGEVLVFETKPLLNPFILRPVMFFVLFAVAIVLFYGSYHWSAWVALVGFIFLIASLVWSPLGWGVSILLFLLFSEMAGAVTLWESAAFFTLAGAVGFMTGVIVEYLSWLGRRFALTSEKILAQRGLISRRSYQCPHDKVQNVTVTQGVIQRLLGYGTVAFWTAGTGGGTTGFGSESRILGGGGVLWDGISDPLDLKTYAEEVINVFTRERKRQEYREMAATLVGTQREPRAPAGAKALFVEGSSPSSEKGSFCPNCGKPTDPGQTFCRFCGGKL